MESKVKLVNQILLGMVLLTTLGLLLGVGWGVWKRVEMLDKLLSKSNDTLTQVALSARTIQATSKSFQEQLDDPETIKARKNTQLAMTGAVQHLAYVTLPRVDETLGEVKGQTKSIGTGLALSTSMVNETVLPAYTDLALSLKLDLSETSRKLTEAITANLGEIGVSQAEVSKELVSLLKSGKITSDNLSLTTEEINSRVKVFLDNSNSITHNLAETTKELPKVAKTARKWQPILNGARLTALLLGVFLP